MDGLRVSIEFHADVPDGVGWPSEVWRDAELIAAIHGYDDPQPAELLERHIARQLTAIGVRVHGMSSGYVVPADASFCAEGGLS